MKKKFFAVALATTMIATSTMTAMADAAYYSFDSDAGSATLTGSKSGDAAELTSAKIENGKLVLDGTYGLKLPETITDDTYTVSFKVNYNAVTACTPTVVLCSSFDTPQDWISLGYGWQTEVIPGIWARVETTDVWTDIFSETTLETNKEYTFTYVVDNLAATVYVDGAKVAEGTVQSVKGATIYVGVNAWDTPANCTLDDLVIVNGVATSDVSSYTNGTGTGTEGDSTGTDDNSTGTDDNSTGTGSNTGSTGTGSTGTGTGTGTGTTTGSNTGSTSNPTTSDVAPIAAFAAVAVIACAAVIVSRKKVTE